MKVAYVVEVYIFGAWVPITAPMADIEKARKAAKSELLVGGFAPRVAAWYRSEKESE